MRAHWWSCVLGLLCMPAEVLLSTWTVSQDPLSISLMKVNLSAEITCSTSLTQPLGLYLHRRFHGKRDVLYLHLENGRVTKNTTAAEFVGRIHIAQNQQTEGGRGITLKLSLLGLVDTDLYYCSWKYFKSETSSVETLPSDGTIIIVRERDQCRDHILDLIFIALSVTAFIVVLFLFIGALIVRCKRFKRQFRPARAAHPPRAAHTPRAARPPRAHRPQHICPQQRVQHCPYLVTSVDTLDFRGIL